MRRAFAGQERGPQGGLVRAAGGRRRGDTGKAAGKQTAKTLAKRGSAGQAPAAVQQQGDPVFAFRRRGDAGNTTVGFMQFDFARAEFRVQARDELFFQPGRLPARDGLGDRVQPGQKTEVDPGREGRRSRAGDGGLKPDRTQRGGDQKNMKKRTHRHRAGRLTSPWEKIK